ncbi:MAG: hypothetical protein ACOVOY_04185 [Sediminibacterium sp.]|jgi:hypothetical protein
MRLPLFIFFILISTAALGQKIQSSNDALRWEISVASGPYLDMFWAIVGDPPSYSNKPGRSMNLGKLDRIELKHLLRNKRSGISLYFQNAQWRELYGIRNDPLEKWKDVTRYCRRMHFTLHYYRMFPSGKKGTWSIGSGFQVQIEKKSFPFYRVDDPTNPTAITEISARPDWTYFEDWAIPLTVAHHWTINKNLKLGIMLNTAYTTGTGIDGLSLLGNIAIPFGKQIRK